MTNRQIARSLAAAALLAACAVSAAMPPACTASGDATEASPVPVETGGRMRSGPILETMNAAGYTYARVRTPDGEVWVAGPQIAVKVGDTVSFPPGMPMEDFRSKALDRTFEKILFVSAIRLADAASPGAGAPTGAAKPAAPHAGVGSAPPSSVDLSGIERPEGGVTVGAIYGDKTGLAGKEVLVRAKVVKSNNGIMGRNWLHLRDGTSGPEGENDLTVTTMGTAKVGDTVLVRGKLTVEKDFGFGYRYDVIVEDATVTVETGAPGETKT